MQETQAEKRAARFVAQYLENNCAATGEPVTELVDELALYIVKCDHAAETAELLGQTELAAKLRTTCRNLRKVAIGMPVGTLDLLRALTPMGRDEVRRYVAQFGNKLCEAYDERQRAEAGGNPDLLSQFDPSVVERLSALDGADLGTMADLAEQIIAAAPYHPENSLLRAAVAACVGRLVHQCAEKNYSRLADEASRHAAQNAAPSRPIGQDS
jgi:hypothetical protein